MENDGQDTVAAQSSAKPKKSLFKKSAFAKSSEEAEAAVDFFSRSREIFSDIVAENQKKRQKQELEKKRSQERVQRLDPGKQEPKRRRISTEAEDQESAPSSSDDELTRQLLQRASERNSSATTPPSGRSGSHSAKTKRSTSIASISKEPQQSPSVTTRSRKKLEDLQRPVIALSDSESEDDVYVRPSPLKSRYRNADDVAGTRQTTKPTSEEKFQLSEEEEELFPELVAEARAKAKQRLLGRLNPSLSKATTDSSGDEAGSASEASAPTASATSPEVDPVVQLLVSSEIDGTKAVIMKRKLSQRMKDVRLAWCDRQLVNDRPLNAEMKAAIFLTWKRKRIFDVTTGKALGLRFDSSGTLQSDGEGVNHNGQIHLEAWTEETFAEFEKMRAKEQEKQQKAIAPVEEEEEEVPEPKPKSDPTPRFKIILKGKDVEPFKLVVKSTIYIAAIIAVYKKHRGVPPEKEVNLYLDGDKLDPSGVTGDLDLDPEDTTTVDVHVSGDSQT